MADWLDLRYRDWVKKELEKCTRPARLRNAGSCIYNGCRLAFARAAGDLHFFLKTRPAGASRLSKAMNKIKRPLCLPTIAVMMYVAAIAWLPWRPGSAGVQRLGKKPPSMSKVYGYKDSSHGIHSQNEIFRNSCPCSGAKGKKINK